MIQRPTGRWTCRVAIGLLLVVLGGCGSARGPGSTSVSTGAGSAASPTPASPTRPGASTPATPGPATPSPLGTPELDLPAPNGGPGAACSGFAISLWPDARGQVSPRAAVAAYLHENPDYSSTPADRWTVTLSEPGEAQTARARAGATWLELTRLADGTWLATSGMRC